MTPIEYSLKESFGTSEPHDGHGQNDEEIEEHILCSSELGSVHSLNRVIQKNPQENQEATEKLLKKSTSMASVTSHNTTQNKSSSMSLRENDTPQSIPLADLDGELQISNLSLNSSKSYQQKADLVGESELHVSKLSLASSKSLQSIQSYNGSIKVRFSKLSIAVIYTYTNSKLCLSICVSEHIKLFLLLLFLI